MVKTRSLLVAFVLALTLTAHGQIELTLQTSTNVIPLGGQVTVSISVSGNVQDNQEPDFPDLEAFSVEQAGASRQFSSINGRTSSASIYTYILTARKSGRFTLPPIPVDVNGTIVKTKPVVIEVLPGAGGPGAPRNQPGGVPGFTYPSYPNLPAFPPIANSPWGGPPGMRPGQPGLQPGSSPQQNNAPLVLVEAEVSNRDPFVNEPVIYTFRFLHRVNPDGNPNYEPATATGFLREELGQRTYQTTRNGVSYGVSEAKTAFFPTTAGQFTLGPTRLTCRISLEDLTRFSNFTSLMDANRELVAEAIPITVHALPNQGRPSDFTGGVGSFTIKARLDKTKVEQGQPFNLLIDVEGDGHPDMVSEPTLPPSDLFKYYKSTSKVSKENERVFRGKKSFQIPIVPLKSGKLSLPPISLSYFDPHEKRYETAVTPVLSVQVTPSKSAPSATPTPEASTTPAARDENAPRPPKPTLLGQAPRRDLPGWAWMLQALPWAALVAWRAALRLKTWWRDQSAVRYHSSAGRRACAALARLKPERVDEALPLLYAYLETRLGETARGTSLSELDRKLSERSLQPEERLQLRALLEELEAYRYAPATQRAAASDLIERASSLIQRMEPQWS